MPATRRKQSNAMLYTLIIFVGLSIVAIVAAGFYYSKAEEYRISRNDTQSELKTFASDEEQSNVGSIVGSAITEPVRTTYLGTMVLRLDKAISLIVGGAPEATNAEVKISNATAQAANMIKLAEPYIGAREPNITGLTQVITSLTQKIQETITSKEDLQKKYEDSIADFGATQAINEQNIQALTNEKNKLKNDFNDIKQKYDEIAQELETTTDDRVESLKAQLNQIKDNLKTINNQLLQKEAILTETQDMLAQANKKLEVFGKPSDDSMAYIPDGKIISIDNETKIVYINLGSNDHVYRGLTFAVYDKGSYIGEEGQNKAEIEVFDISDTYSAARITKSAINRPILQDDIVANLIWDSKKVNQFVIAGDFDLNGDGKNDFDAIPKIKAVIEKWGGKVTDKISIETDFLILGKQPQLLSKPSLDEQEADPSALQKYQSTLEKMNRYDELQNRATALWIPIFTYEKFIYLIGYSEQSTQAGAF